MEILSNEIHLWFVNDEEVDDTELVMRYHSFLNEKESRQQKRFYTEQLRHQYLMTRALVRSVLSLYREHVYPSEWQFDKNKYGKPFIVQPEANALRFNLSHTKQMVVLAVTKDQEVGVDVEHIERTNDTVSIAEHYFSPVELADLQALPPERQKQRFFELWTLKEAYIKACGMGLSIPLDHFSYRFLGENRLTIGFEKGREDQPEYWRLWRIDPCATHQVALALKDEVGRGNYKLTMREITPSYQYSEVSFPVVGRDCSSSS